MDNEFFVMFASFLIDPNWWQNENHWSCFSKLQACKEFLTQFHLHFCRKERNNETPQALSRVSEEGFDPVFPRHFHDNSAYPVLLLSLSRVTFSFPIPQPLPSPASRVAIKSRIPSTNFVFFRIIAALYFGYTAYRRIPRIHPSLPDPPWGQVNLFMQRRNRVTLTSKQLEVT